MTLRRSFRPLRTDLDKVLFAAVGEEIDGIPLSTISALTRLGLDPWQEAGSDFIAAPSRGVACLFRARRSRAGERNHPWRIYVRNWKFHKRGRRPVRLGGAQNYRR